MQLKEKRRKDRGLTIFEIGVVIAVVAVIVVIAAAIMAAPGHVKRENCRNIQRAFGTAFRLWADNNDGRFPMLVSIKNGGAMEAVAQGAVYQVFKCMSNELSTPKMMECPSDTRPAATNFSNLQNSNICYFVAADADEKRSTMLLSGDRNLIIDDKEVGTGLGIITKGAAAAWTRKIHNRSGNLLLADGSAMTVPNSRLQSVIARTGTNVNRLVFP